MTERLDDSGFSLPEVLVVLAIVALATSLLVGQVRIPPAASVSTTPEMIGTARQTAMRSGAPQATNAASSTRAADRVVVFPDGSLSHFAGGSAEDAGNAIGIARRSFNAMELR